MLRPDKLELEPLICPLPRLGMTAQYAADPGLRANSIDLRMIVDVGHIANDDTGLEARFDGSPSTRPCCGGCRRTMDIINTTSMVALAKKVVLELSQTGEAGK
ncbi:hypothetical protein PG989_016373 [Apiospora arundinis]